VKTKKSQASGEKTIKGELFRVDDANYFVKAMDGSEIRLHTDKTTNMFGKIKKGDQIEATVNDQNHALSIQAIKSREPRDREPEVSTGASKMIQTEVHM
jgi:hypothetical protein